MSAASTRPTSSANAPAGRPEQQPRRGRVGRKRCLFRQRGARGGGRCFRVCRRFRRFRMEGHSTRGAPRWLTSEPSETTCRRHSCLRISAERRDIRYTAGPAAGACEGLRGRLPCTWRGRGAVVRARYDTSRIRRGPVGRGEQAVLRVRDTSSKGAAKQGPPDRADDGNARKLQARQRAAHSICPYDTRRMQPRRLVTRNEDHRKNYD